VPPADGMVGVGAEGAVVEGPRGEGWIVQIKGYHFHNKDRHDAGAKFVKETFIEGLENKKIRLPDGLGGKLKLVAIKDLGIGYPVIVRPWPIRTIQIRDPNADALEEAANAGPLGRGVPAPDVPVTPPITLKQFDFILQFCWQETPLSKRLNPQPKSDAEAADNLAVAGGN